MTAALVLSLSSAVPRVAVVKSIVLVTLSVTSPEILLVRFAKLFAAAVAPAVILSAPAPESVAVLPLSDAALIVAVTPLSTLIVETVPKFPVNVDVALNSSVFVPVVAIPERSYDESAL